ncbi:MAG: enoyl-CoA hydratase/isomerase family protein [Sciscionella sp.]
MTATPAPDGLDVVTSFNEQTHVGVIELNRPPNNFLDITLLRAMCDALAAFDAEGNCHALVLAAGGKHFCAGRDFSKPRGAGDDSASIYREAWRLLDLRTPVVVAVQGAAIGAGLGLALWADFRFCSTRAYFAANFVQVGLHHGFGLSVTLPRLVGTQRASELLYLGEKIGAERAFEIGLVDHVYEAEELREQAVAFAAKIASGPPQAVQAIRATLRQSLAEEFRAATERESQEQAALARTAKAT